MRCKKCKCYPDNGGQYGGLNDEGLCSSCSAWEHFNKKCREGEE